MNITETIQSITHLFLDTAPVIYAVELNPQYLQNVSIVFERILSGSLIGVISPVTLAECLVQPYLLGQTQLQRDFIELLTENDNIEFMLLNEQLSQQASQIRARYNLQLLDAFQIAVALAAGCEAFLTNDVIFRRITELQVLILDDFDAVT